VKQRTEADLNNDVLNGFPVGTTAARKREIAACDAKRDAERARLVSEGIDEVEAFYLSYGCSQEKSKECSKEYYRSSRRRRGSRGQARHWTQASQADFEKRNSSSYRAGQEAGQTIGLDIQVGASNRKAITGK
jgi:hypothetical protein